MTLKWFRRKQKRQRKGVQCGGQTRFRHSGTEKQTVSRTGGHRKKNKKSQRGQMVWICPEEGFGMYG